MCESDTEGLEEGMERMKGDWRGEWKGMERNRRGCGLEGVIEGNKRE